MEWFCIKSVVTRIRRSDWDPVLFYKELLFVRDSFSVLKMAWVGNFGNPGFLCWVSWVPGLSPPVGPPGLPAGVAQRCGERGERRAAAAERLGLLIGASGAGRWAFGV